MSISIVYRQPILTNVGGVIVVMSVWWLDLQLSVQLVPITTKVGSLNPAVGDVY
jgi:hypothetical protein